MEKIEISVEKARAEPNYKTTAASLLIACRKFYQDPENEKKYQEGRKRHEKLFKADDRHPAPGIQRDARAV